MILITENKMNWNRASVEIGVQLEDSYNHRSGQAMMVDWSRVDMSQMVRIKIHWGIGMRTGNDLNIG